MAIVIGRHEVFNPQGGHVVKPHYREELVDEERHRANAVQVLGNTVPRDSRVDDARNGAELKTAHEQRREVRAREREYADAVTMTDPCRA